tara:strand:+ start:235 stop:1122 length:888 start_codon:yes stop_codon:yes gene_type:complete
MTANKIHMKVSLDEKQVTIPLGQSFDEIGREQLIETWEEVELQDNINFIQDYETTRYTHYNPYDDYKIHYKFLFFSAGSYYDDFNILGYKDYELARTRQSFKNSFFKFDFYDSPVKSEQKLMFTSVMPANNCRKEQKLISFSEDPVEYWSQMANLPPIPTPMPMYGVYVPDAILSPEQGKNENYYIQWLKNRDLFTGTSFYMSCKFYNAKDGKVIRMVTQAPINPGTGAIVPGPYSYEDWFFYQVILKIDSGNAPPKYRYTVHPFSSLNIMSGVVSNQTGTMVGDEIMFYEYIAT